MRIGNGFTYIFLILAAALPTVLRAQSSSLNTFSPYTLYGIGDLHTQGPVEMRAMGGGGTAFQSPLILNNLNPASYSTFGQKSFLFNVGLDGGNYYLRSQGSDGVMRKSSFNTFNISNISLGFPITRGLGFSVSLSPYSNVGYRIGRKETNPDILASIGQVTYTNVGEGSINQIKAGFGLAITKHISVGAELVYLKGQINRMYDVTVTPVLTSGTYYSVTSSNYSDISRMLPLFGAQWIVTANRRRAFVAGATYQMGTSLKAENYRYIPSNNIHNDIVADNLPLPSDDLKLPSVISAGLYYTTPKWSLTGDYKFQNWGVNTASEYDYVKYVNTNSVRLGAQLVPNRDNFRNILNLWSYRAGLRYDQYYMQVHGKRVNEMAATLGFGIPIKPGKGGSSINVGLEAGRRGSAKGGLVLENFFKISLGLSLIGEDFWFVRPKYD